MSSALATRLSNVRHISSVQAQILSSFHHGVSNSFGRQTVAIRREDQSIWERRAPLAPVHVEKLTKRGVRVLIQPSNRRAYPIQAYERAGAEAREDISESPVILGVKQVDINELLPEKTYCFFSHTIKAQDANMPLLDAVLEKRIRLIDYECLKDDNNQRLVAFGKFAGYAGMIDILHGIGLRLLALGHHTPFMHIGPAHNYRNVGAAKQAVRDAGYEIALGNLPQSIGPLTFVFTGTGNVSQGAQEVFAELPIEFVQPSKLPEVAKQGSTSKIYGCILGRSDHIVRKGDANGKFDPDEYQTYPERFESNFNTKVAPYASVIVNGIFWEQRFPRLLTTADAKKLLLCNADEAKERFKNRKLPHRLLAICDISADPSGSIEFMDRCSEIDKPFYLYDAELNGTSEDLAGNGVLLCSIDNMPTQLPLESTDMFGNLLLPYMNEIIRSQALRSIDEERFSSIVQKAIITNNGELVGEYEKIRELRAAKLQSSNGSSTGAGTKQVLVLGAGHVSGPLIEYLSQQDGVHVKVVSASENELKRVCENCEGLSTALADFSDDQSSLETLVGKSDLVISLLPYSMHPMVAKICIEQRKNMLTASYLSAELRELDGQAKEAGITIMNEIGLDPGIDHLLAKRAIDQALESGDKILSFKSYCCGLPTPEFAQNPLGYKFSWNPAGAFAIVQNPAKWLEGGQVYECKPGSLMDHAKKTNFIRGFALEGFPNRNSLEYKNLYDLNDVQTLVRGTLRYDGFSDTIKALGQLGLLDKSEAPILKQAKNDKLSWPQVLIQLLANSGGRDLSMSNLRSFVYDKVGKCEKKFQSIVDLGLLNPDESPVLDPIATTPFEFTRNWITKKYSVKSKENDLIILKIIMEIEKANSRREEKSVSLVVYGDNKYSAMAKTVGFPAAIASKMILDGEITTKGMVMPLEREIYQPILKRLESFGIVAEEK